MGVYKRELFFDIFSLLTIFVSQGGSMDNQSASQHHDTTKASPSSGINKYLWIIGAVVLLAVGGFGAKAILSPIEEYRVTLVDSPKEATAGYNSTFTWRVDGPPTSITNTSVHYGAESNPGELKQDVKPGDTKYSDFVKDFANGKFDIPLQFVGNTVVAKPGKYYFRVHALIKDKNYWSDEYTMDVKPMDYKVTLINAANEVMADKTFTITWRIDGLPTSIPSTAAYFGTESTSGTLDKTVKPSDTKYTGYTKDFIKGSYNVPLQFIGNTKVDAAGTYYMRIHAEINGQHYWSDEVTFTAKEETAVTKTQ